MKIGKYHLKEEVFEIIIKKIIAVLVCFNIVVEILSTNTFAFESKICDIINSIYNSLNIPNIQQIQKTSVSPKISEPLTSSPIYETSDLMKLLVKGDFDYTVDDDGTAIIFGNYKVVSGNIAIPDKVDGKTITSIGKYAFSDYIALTSIEIPNSVTSIGQIAFSNCTGLTSIKMPNNLISIGPSAFVNCTGLTNIEIPDNVTSIEGYAFSGCTGLTSIKIPSGVTYIDIGVFSECTGLTSIEIPSSVTSIGENVFYDCDKLTIRCYMNSYAYDYATQNKIPTEIITKYHKNQKLAIQTQI